MQHHFQVKGITTQGEPFLGHISGSSGALDAACSLPEEWGGTGNATGTGELLAGAAACCYMITLRMQLKREGLVIDRLEVDAEGTMIVDHAGARIDRITLWPKIAVAENTPETVRRVSELARSCSSHCVISKALAGNVEYIIEEPVVY